MVKSQKPFFDTAQSTLHFAVSGVVPHLRATPGQRGRLLAPHFSIILQRNLTYKNDTNYNRNRPKLIQFHPPLILPKYRN